MAKILVKYIKGIDNFVPGDVRGIELSEYKKLKKNGFVVKLDEVEFETEGIEAYELTGRNILGKKYKKGFVDVVIPTMSKNNIKSLKKLKALEKRGKISLNVMVRKFSEKVGGFAKACNDGAKMNDSLGEFILILNDDVKLGKGFFKDLLVSFESESVGMVGAECSKVSWGLNGSLMCIRRELFEMIGGFDENYFFMFEDNDLCENVRRRGYSIEVSNAKALHPGGESVNTLSEFWRKNYYNGKAYYDRKWLNNERIIGSMIVGNEANRYMSRVIIDLFKRNLIDEMVVVCDKSDKATLKELTELKKYYPVDIKYHDFKLFGRAENVLRERAIQYAISKNPFGIIPIDADEFFDEEICRPVLLHLLRKGIAWDFVLAHYWGDENTVRIDGAFSNQKNVRLFRYCPEYLQNFYETGLHCGSAPIYAYKQRKSTEYVLKHLGYIKKEDVEAKKKRQEEFDPKMLLENPDLYKRMIEDGEVMPWNKKEFLEIWKK